MLTYAARAPPHVSAYFRADETQVLKEPERALKRALKKALKRALKRSGLQESLEWVLDYAVLIPGP
jgi:hypothetical protein